MMCLTSALHLFRRILLQHMLNIESDQECHTVAIFRCDAGIVHGAFLHRMKNVDARFNEVIQDGRVVAARVQPPMEVFAAPGMRRFACSTA